MPSLSYHLGVELLSQSDGDAEQLLKMLWHYQDAILCCSFKVSNEINSINVPSFDLISFSLLSTITDHSINVYPCITDHSINVYPCTLKLIACPADLQSFHAFFNLTKTGSVNNNLIVRKNWLC